MTDKQRLLAVRKRLKSEKSWTKGAAAREESGPSCPTNSVRAVRWCLAGALTLEGANDLFAGLYFGPARSIDYVRHIMNFNDRPETAHKDVLRALDKAISDCQT